MEQQIANLPLPALLAFGATLGAVWGARVLGLLQGQKASPASPASSQVAAVVVDPTALNRASSAIEEHTEALLKGTEVLRETNRHLNTLGMEADRIREELRIHRELRRQ
jgi:hypothetical protein